MLRVLRLVRMFTLIRVFRSSFYLIVDTFSDSFTTLNTIVFLIFLSGMVMSALMFTVEAHELDPLTHVSSLLSHFHWKTTSWAR